MPPFVTNLLGPNNSLKSLLSMKAIAEREEKEHAPLQLGLFDMILDVGTSNDAMSYDNISE